MVLVLRSPPHTQKQLVQAELPLGQEKGAGFVSHQVEVQGQVVSIHVVYVCVDQCTHHSKICESLVS